MISIARDRDDWETGAVPEMTSEERNLGHVDEHRLHVTADCHPHGINISFSVQSDVSHLRYFNMYDVMYDVRRITVCSLYNGFSYTRLYKLS